MTHSLNLSQGRRSPLSITQDQRSPQGRRSPIFLTLDHRSPVDQFPPSDRRSPTSMLPDRRSPTTVHTQGRLSPLAFAQVYVPEKRTSPVSTVHVQDRRSPISMFQGSDDEKRSPTLQIAGRRSPIGSSQGLISAITPTERRSPVIPLQIPPITVSNPSETCAIIEKMLESTVTVTESSTSMIQSSDKSDEKRDKCPSPVVEQRKEKGSVMREILAAFVRKPSKRTSTSTRTSRFAAAFSRAESNSATPLLRQSTFSSSPPAASRAAKSAVTKQISESGGFESKMSLKLLNAKMSLRLRKSDDKKKDKKSSGDEMSSDMESDNQRYGSAADIPFELEHIKFEKVGESYIKHERIREETFEDSSPVQVIAESDTQNNNDTTKEPEIDEETRNILKRALDEMITNRKPSYENLIEFNKEYLGLNQNQPIQCPTFEIEPPSRRSSFDPPRSPYLENLRSPGGDTDPELMCLNRLDSGGDSFELMETDKNRESSFDSRYPSSRDTSFDISRYQSTSYEDQTSSFEIIDIDISKSTNDGIDVIRKSSIEMTEIESFKKSSCSVRKSSLETHFDYQAPMIGDFSGTRGAFAATKSPTNIAKKYLYSNVRAKSPLSTQTSSNYSSHDSYDSGFEPISLSRNGNEPPLRQHFPLTIATAKEAKTFLCTDQRCAAIFEPRPKRTSSPFLGYSSGSEFDPPSPRRASSASPKHTFTFRIVLKKVDSSPDAINTMLDHRRRSKDRNERCYKRRDSRKKRFFDSNRNS